MESIESLGQKAFLKSVHPFDLLKDDELDYVLKSLDMLYFQKDEAILTEGEKAKELYIIMKGRVREIESETEVNYFEERESFDASSLLSQVNKKTYIAVEETICYALPGKVFLEFINSNNSFESYYLLTIKEKLNNLIHRNVNKEMASFMIQRVKDCMIQPAIVVDKSYSILDAVRIMTNHKMSSILVDSGDPKKPGIVTDTDLREKVILANLSYSEAVEQIATYDLISISVNDFLFNAMILMIEHSVKRLIVYDGGNVRGILEQTDVLGTMSHKSHLVDQRIKKANSLKELKIVHDDLVLLIKSLISTGVKVRYIVKLLAELDLKLYKKLYHLLAPQELIENSCFIVLGSEGRKEQILKTDQDNAIILRDGYNPVKFRELCDSITGSLLEFGYPRCEGDIMVCNPYWSKELSEYKAELSKWIKNPQGESLMNLSILFDARAMAGDSKLLDSLKYEMRELSRQSQIFLSYFARPTLMFETPLSFFSRFRLDKSNHRNELDIKRGGIFPIVHGVRSLALENNIPETNTIERIKKLKEMTVLDNNLADELIESFNYMLTIRLVQRLEKREKGFAVDNYINPNHLPRLERDLLRDVLKVVHRFKDMIKLHFRLELIH